MPEPPHEASWPEPDHHAVLKRSIILPTHGASNSPHTEQTSALKQTIILPSHGASCCPHAEHHSALYAATLVPHPEHLHRLPSRTILFLLCWRRHTATHTALEHRPHGVLHSPRTEHHISHSPRTEHHISHSPHTEHHISLTGSIAQPSHGTGFFQGA